MIGRGIDLAVWRPSHATFWRDQLVHLHRNEHAGHSEWDHLLAAAEWLGRAQDATGDGGVSGRYSMSAGWTSSYPETTGYIIPTFLALAANVDPVYRARAQRCVEFLKGVQLEDGAFPAGEVNENRTKPSVFNTAQILNGLVAWHAETGDAGTEQMARRAADWIVAQQDTDGAFRRNIYGNPTTYTSHASCWLAEAGRHFKVEAWSRSAERHLDWVLSHRDASTGWIDYAGFMAPDHEARRAVTHTLAYTIWGVLLLSQLLNREDGIAAARSAALGVARRIELSGWLPGEIDSNWKAARSDFACLTGNAQMALIWFRLAEIDRDTRFVNAALKAIDLVSAAQSMDNADPGIRGAIPGSAPIWGDYIYMAFPNWAAKFYVDALFARQRALALVAERPPRDWKIPGDIPRNVPAAPPSAKAPPARVVMLSSPGSTKVPTMVRAWAAWGFRPAAVILERAPDAPLATRVMKRVRDDGFIALLAGPLRRLRPSTQSSSSSTTSVATGTPNSAAASHPADVVAFCEAEGIPVLRAQRLSDPQSVAALRALNPDLLVHAGAGIIRRDVMETARFGAVNVHMGILPRYRGMNVAEWARLEGNPVGCTVHLIDSGIDTGDIIAVGEVDTTQARSIQALRDAVDKRQIELLGDVVRFISTTGTLPLRRSQSGTEGRQYFRMHHDLKAILTAMLLQRG